MTVNFNFKCHRVEDKQVLRRWFSKPLSPNFSQGNQAISNAFPCNGVSFNSKYNTMATCGSDGTYVFWDKDNRQKLKAYPDVPQARAGSKPAAPATYGNSIIDIDFSPDSNFVAFAVAYTPPLHTVIFCNISPGTTGPKALSSAPPPTRACT
jgi:WD40 repeat protein